MSDPNAQPPVDPAAGQPPYTTPPQQPQTAPSQHPYAQQQPGQPYAQTQPGAPLTQEQDRQYAMLAHLGGILAVLALFTGWLGLLALIPALVIYLAYAKRGALAGQESKEALNFQITMVGAMIIWAIIAAIITAALFFSLAVGAWFAIALVLALVGWALVVIDVAFSIVAGVRVKNGGTYRYPFALRFVK
jgi:uncharacterized Tic20 family protein